MFRFPFKRIAPSLLKHRLPLFQLYNNKIASFSLAPQPLKNIQKDVPEYTKPNQDEMFIGMNGGQIFEAMMMQLGVEVVFGYPGGAILPIYDGIYNSPNFKFILPRHEQGGGHMAEGYARVTGKPGVLLVTSGPGATNTVTPLQDALSDGIPLIVFTGQVPTTAIGSDAFQEADVLGITRPCTKWNTMVSDISDLPRVLREAFHIATTGRPGPVLVDLPKDVTASILQIPCDSTPALPSMRRNRLRRRPDGIFEERIRQAADLINIAKKPLIYAGAGTLHCSDLLRQLATKANIPCTTTLQGLGAFDENHPLSMHMLGMHGSAYANYAMQNADLIIGLGARFDDRVTGNLKLFAPAAKKAAAEGTGGIVHFEILDKNINKIVESTVAVQGDTKVSLETIMPLIENKNENNSRKEWIDQCQTWKRDHPFEYFPSAPGAPIKPETIIQELNRQLEGNKENVIISTGVGQHQMWAAQYYNFTHPHTWVTSGGLGTMGFGLPSAIGAKIAYPDKIVIDVDGDGSLSMTAMELQTAAEYGINVKVLVLNNNFQGMVKQWQDLFYEKRYAGTKMHNPNWVKFAESMNCKGLFCDKNENLSSIIKEFLEYDDTPILLEVMVDEDEHVYPMVPAGKALDDMVIKDPKLYL